MTGMAAPALYVVQQGSRDRDALPSADAVREAVISGIEATWGGTYSATLLRDVRRGEVPVQDEEPPADPVEMPGVVVVFGQVALTDYNPYAAGEWTAEDVDSPLLDAMRGVQEQFDGLEVWLDAVAIHQNN